MGGSFEITSSRNMHAAPWFVFHVAGKMQLNQRRLPAPVPVRSGRGRFALPPTWGRFVTFGDHEVMPKFFSHAANSMAVPPHAATPLFFPRRPPKRLGPQANGDPALRSLSRPHPKSPTRRNAALSRWNGPGGIELTPNERMWESFRRDDREMHDGLDRQDQARDHCQRRPRKATR